MRVAFPQVSPPRAPQATIKASKPKPSVVEKSPPVVRKRYISPLEKQVGAVLDKSDLDFFGKCLLRFIREEAKKDAAKTHQVPTTSKFYESFTYQVKENTIEVSSSWPWIDLIIQGTDGPYKMKWLTQAKGVFKVPMRDKSGMMVIRSTPLTTDKAWIHPGIARHTFIERAFRRARKACVERFLSKNISKILGNTIK